MTETATYTVTGDINDLAGWDVPTFAAAMREAFAASGLNVEVIERPSQSGGGGYTGGDAALSDRVKAIADRVSTSAEVSR